MGDKTLKDLVEVAKGKERWRRLTKIELKKEPHHDCQHPGKDMTKEEVEEDIDFLSNLKIFIDVIKSTNMTYKVLFLHSLPLY